MITQHCIQCGKCFETYRSRIGRIVTCSKQCSVEHRKVIFTGSGNPFYGKKHTAKSIEQNSKSHIGQIAWNRGAIGIYSEEHLRKIRVARAKQVGDKHPNWKGGKRNFRGYVAIYSPSHPMRDKNNCTYEHRLVMEKHIGRFLSKKEVVHHVNMIKTDNRIENLMLFKNNSEHLLEHSRMGTIKGRPKKVVKV